MDKEKYQPTPEEIQKAEDLVKDEQKKMSDSRDLRVRMEEGKLTSEEIEDLAKEDFIKFCEQLPPRENPWEYISGYGDRRVRSIKTAVYEYTVIRGKDSKLFGEVSEIERRH